MNCQNFHADRRAFSRNGVGREDNINVPLRKFFKCIFMRKSIFIGILIVSALSSTTALGQVTAVDCEIDTTVYSSAIGNQTKALGMYSFAAGYRVQAVPDNSFVFGTGDSVSLLSARSSNSFLIGFERQSVFFAQLKLQDGVLFPRVGIGTVMPRATLDVNGTTRTGTLRMDNPSFQYNKEKNLGFYPTTGDVFIFPQTPTLFLSDAGVGIMTDNPTSTLDVNGNVRADTVKIKNSIFLPEKELSFTYYADGTDPNHPDSLVIVNPIKGDSTVLDGVGIGSGGVNTMMVLKRVSNDSRLGIGVTAPAQNLHVFGNGLLSERLAVGSSETGFYGLTDLRLLLGNLWTFSDMSSSKIMGYNCRFLETGAQGRIITGSAAAIKMNSNGSIQLCTAPSGTVSPNINFNYLTMLNNGRVGIGTPDPKYPLDVNGSANFDKIYTNIIEIPGTELRIIKITEESTGPGNEDGKGGQEENPKDDPEEGQEENPEEGGRPASVQIDIITIKDNGRVGIGTTIPATTFHVQGTTYLDGKLGVGTSAPSKKLHVQGDSYFSGAVGIGTTDPGEYKLRINGKINCKEVVVTADGMQNSDEWPDYVFADDYDLRSLDEVASYIEENQRLPEIPSAADVAEKGVSLLEINTLLLKKVEELTLYILQQNEKMTDLQGQIDELKKR